MECAFVELGSVEIVDSDPYGILFQYRSAIARLRLPQTIFRLGPVADGFAVDDTGEPHSVAHRQGPVPAPFTRTALGKKTRLAWPRGATALGEYAHLTGWDDRFAVVLDDRGFSVIDAESDRIARLMLPPDALAWNFADPIASAGYVWAAVTDGIVAIPFGALEAMEAGSVELAWARHHPLRQPEARLDCVFLWHVQSGEAMLEIGNGKGGPNEPKLRVALAPLGLAKYTPVTLVDELRPWWFAAVEVPGHGRIALAPPEPLASAGKVTITRAKDPTGVAKAPESARPAREASSEELARLVAAVAASDDDAPRAVLADLLIELGDPSADAIAAVRATGKASPAKLREALGPLGPYLTKVELLGGFPVEATVSQHAPDARAHAAELQAARADFRLALLHTLHAPRGRASRDVYAWLAAASSSLRRVDVSFELVIDELIAARRGQVERLDHVDFAKADWMEKLATDTFDRATTVHTVIGLAHLQPLVNRLRRDTQRFFRRTPRRLLLDETMGRDRELLQALAPAWRELPVTALGVGGITIERSGQVTGTDPTLVALAEDLFAP